MTEHVQLETRLTKVEFEVAGVKEDVGGVSRDLRAFREEWSTKADEDRKAHRSQRLTLPQMVSMGAAVATTTAIILGGIIYMINSQIATARLDMNSQIAQVGLTVRGTVDSLTATNAALSQLQRDMGVAQVKIGLIDQLARSSSDILRGMEHYDADLARLDERIKANTEMMRRLRDRPPPA